MSRRYPRLFHPDFLAYCGVGVKAVYAYWDAKRGDRAAPSRAEIEPLEIRPWLPGIVIVDVVRFPDQLIYRLVGTRAVEARGSDPTGKTVMERYFGDDRDEILEDYRLVIEEKRAVYDFDHTPTRDGYFEEAEVLLLPLSSDGDAVDKVLIYFEARRRGTSQR